MWTHAIALAVVLAAVMPFVGTSSMFNADEGAAIAEAHLLSDGRGWTMSHPFPEADPSGEAFPLEISQRRGDQYAPFVKHPLYALLLAGADKIGGRTAMVALSVAGTWCAAVVVALLTRLVAGRRASGVLALWILGIASPLFLDGYVLIAHTLGAACVAFAALWFVRVLDRAASPLAALVIGVAVVVAVLLRTEAVLLGVALTVGGLAVAGRRRDRALGIVALAPVVAAGLGTLIERRWATSIMGGASIDTAPFGRATRGGVVDHLHGLVITVLAPSYNADVAAFLSLAVAVLVVAAGIVVVRNRDDREGPFVFLGAALVAGVVRLFLPSESVPGLLVAFPLLVLAAVLLPWRKVLADDRVFALVVAVALFGIAVVATQYERGGSGEWGGRYFAIGLPLVAPVVVLALGRIPDVIGSSRARAVGLLLASALVPIAVLAAQTLRDAHDAGDRLVSDVAAVAARTPAGDGGLPVVMSTDGVTARYSVDELDDGRWLTVKLDDIGSYSNRLAGLGVRAFTLVARHAEDSARANGFRVSSVTQPLGGWYVTVLQAG